MRILSPVDRASEVPALCDAGADEFYAGYIPPFWSEAFGPVVTCNRRSFPEASVGSLDELDAILFEAAVRDAAVHVAVNASPIPDAMIPPMEEMAAGFALRGVRGVIVSDLGLMVALRDRKFRRMEIHASTLFSAFNAAAVAFLRRAGASRVVLARELSTADIAATVSAAPAFPIEVLGFRGRCPNIEGFCTHLHDDPDRTWPCELRYEKEPFGGRGSVSAEVAGAIERDEGGDRHFSCGLCAVPLIERAGVHAFKIVGRGAGTPAKVEAVRAVAAMRRWGREAMPDAAACARRGKELYRETFGRPCRRENCYFPEFRPGEPEGSDAAREPGGRT